MTESAHGRTPGLLERLDSGPVICAEGYLFELERRGYLQAGAYVPEVVLEHPGLVAQLHREFVHAGSDVVEAFTYYGHREKLRLIGKEHLLEELNRGALSIAKEVADESGSLFAGDICNTNVFEPDRRLPEDRSRHVRGAGGLGGRRGRRLRDRGDLLVGPGGAARAGGRQGSGAARRRHLAVHREPVTWDGWTPAEACARLEEAGADVVGLNCIRGPATMLPLVKEIRERVDCHVAALPVPYRTHDDEPSFQSLTDDACDCIPDGRPFPTALDPFVCNRYEIAEFATEASRIGVRYLGVCCGAAPHHIRSMAEALGRTPPASRYSPDMSKHAYFGTDEGLKDTNQAYAERL